MSQNQQAEYMRGESGTQSPPMEDNAPMGVSSIRGGNAGAVPDREQRAGTLTLTPSSKTIVSDAQYSLL